MMPTVEGMLAQQAYLKDLDQRYLRVIAEHSTEVSFTTGEYILHEGDLARQFFIVTRGRTALEIDVPSRGPITIATIGEGEALGWSWLFPPYRWHFDGRALEPTAAIACDGQALRVACERDHDLGYELMKRFAFTIMQRLQSTRLQLLDFYGDGTTPLLPTGRTTGRLRADRQ